MQQLTRQNQTRRCKIDRPHLATATAVQKDAVTVMNCKLTVNQQYGADIKMMQF